MRSASVLAAGVAAALAAVPASGQTPVGPRPCDAVLGAGVASAPGLVPSADLYCMTLTPAPGVRGSAVLELGRRPGPFTVAVAPDGRLRYAPTLTLAGAPPAAALGPYEGYVAWVADPTLWPERRLGVVREGATPLPDIEMDKFLVLVTAEADTTAAERSGKIVFRGGSPSTRMQPADVLEFTLGAGLGGGGAGPAAVADSAGHDHGPPAGEGWILPPMPPGLQMLPAMMALRPDVRGAMPGDWADTASVGAGAAGHDHGAAEPGAAGPARGAAHAAGPMPARPHEVVFLEDGDTLALEAGVVERTVGGHTVRMYAYNGQYPGPLLWVPRGATITVEFTNRIDQPTTVHWHGLRLDNRFDGVPGVTQDAVQPGETFVYQVYFPDPGLYWYHPHVREDVQQDGGLYGNMMVRDEEGGWFGPAHREEVLMLDDLLVADEGVVPWGRERATHGFMGRFGNVFLVNGEPAWELDVRRGEVVRFFLTNVANTRTMNLSFRGPGDTAAPLKVVGSDVGAYEREERVGSVVVAPAERYIAHALFERPGTYALVNRVRGIDHIFGAFFQEEDTLGIVRVSEEAAPAGPTRAFAVDRAHPWVSEDIDPYRDAFGRPPDEELELVLETGELPFVVDRLMVFDSAYFHPVEWSGTMPMMNWASTEREARWKLVEPSTGRENMDIAWDFRLGDVRKIRISNRRRSLHAMQHPVHFHGQRFLVLSVNGVPNDNLVWKDTVLVPVGTTVDILLEASNPGEWMAHCHIAEHLEAGMMLGFTVR